MDKQYILIGIPIALAALVYLAMTFCRQILPFAKAIDKFAIFTGAIANWLVLLACLVSAGNAMFRYLLTPISALAKDPDYANFHWFFSSFTPLIEWYSKNANGFLEMQWYMFAGMVLLGASYTMRVNEHVRVDLIYGMVSDRTRHWIDVLGGVVFVIPMCVILMWFTWPWFVESWNLQEGSNNAGGLMRWPVKLLLPAGFFFLLLQGIAEVIKRAAALRGFYVHEYAYEKPLQ